MSELTIEFDGQLYCAECGELWDSEDRHHPDYDPTPQEQSAVTEGWVPMDQSWRRADEHNPEGF